jgi:putative ABC transport system substrate-binding protein
MPKISPVPAPITHPQDSRAICDPGGTRRIPSAHSNRDTVTAGGLMSYGTDFAYTFAQVGAYTGRILKGVKLADLPVLQSTKFEFVINQQTARSFGIEVPPGVLSITDEVID